MPTTLRGSPSFTSLGLSLIGLLALAFALLCSHQMQQAEARRLDRQVRISAFGDCLQYVSGSTIGSCTSKLGAQQGTAPPPAEMAPGASPGLAPEENGAGAQLVQPVAER